MVILRVPASDSSTAMARAAPPAPNITTFFPRGSITALQRGEEAFAVGVLANELIPATDHAIDRANQCSALAQTAEHRNDGDFVRHRQIEPTEAHRKCTLHRGGEIVRRDLHIYIAPAQAVMLKRPFNHGHSRIASGSL